MLALRSHSALLLRRLLVVAGAVWVCAALVPTESALGATTLNGATYKPLADGTNEFSWTKSGSPYILTNSVTVNAGATLRIDPGVVVKFNNLYGSIGVYGALKVDGTSDERVVFTSYQDDTVAGDTNGDGTATAGAPGQWRRIWASGQVATVDLKYATVRYGGYDCCGGSHSYGVLDGFGGAKVTVEDSLIEHNQHYAGHVSTTGAYMSEMSFQRSVLFDNGGGVSTLNAPGHLRNSVVFANRDRGAYYMYGTSYRGPAPEVMDTDIEQNAREGIFFWIDETSLQQVPTESWPRGSRNNIWQNNAATTSSPVQLGFRGRRREANWKENFWGPDTVFRANPSGCVPRGFAAGRLRYPAATEDPLKPAAGPGPIKSRYDYYFEYPTYTYCYSDDYDVGPCEFAPTRRYHAGAGPDPAIDPRDPNDRPPPLNVSGSLWNARCGGELTNPSYTLDTETSPGSNVAIFVDGQAVLPEGTPNASSRSWSFESASYTDGAHEIKVEATDPLGQTSTAKFTVELPDRTPPDVAPSGALWDAREGSSSYAELELPNQYALTATGGDGHSKMSRLAVYLDGELQADTTAGAGTTSMTLAWTLDTERVDPGDHDLLIKAWDQAGQVTATTARLRVARLGYVPKLGINTRNWDREFPTAGMTLEGNLDAMFDRFARNNIGYARMIFNMKTWQDSGWGRFDTLMEVAGEHQVRVLPILAYETGGDFEVPQGGAAPPSAYTGPAVSEWEAFAKAFAQRYKPGAPLPGGGSRPIDEAIQAWEIWNEPNLNGFFQGAPDAAYYYNQVFRPARDAIKAANADPKARVLVGGLAESKFSPGASEDLGAAAIFLEDIHQAAFPGSVGYDAVSVHPYFPNVTYLDDSLLRLRNVMTAKGVDAKKQIWVTEYGWANSLTRPDGTELATTYGADGPDKQAAKTGAYLELLQSTAPPKKPAKYATGPAFMYPQKGDEGAWPGKQNWFVWAGPWNWENNPRPVLLGGDDAGGFEGLKSNGGRYPYQYALPSP